MNTPFPSRDLRIIALDKRIRDALQTLNEIERELSKLQSAQQQNAAIFERLIRQRNDAANLRDAAMEQKLTDINEILCALRDYSTEKETELRRWRECYDQKILRNFLVRLSDVIGEFDEKILACERANMQQEHCDDLKFMRNCLLDALDGEGISSFGEEFVGQKFEIVSSKEFKFIPLETQDPAQENIIHSLQERGYKLFDGNGEKLIQPATLRRYKFSPKTSKQ